MPANLDPRITLADFGQILFRQKRKFCGFFIAVVVFVSVVTLFSKRVYRAEGQLLLRLGRENVTLDSTSTLGNSPVVAVPNDREHEINSVVQILNSRVLAEKVVDAVGPQAILRPGKHVVQQSDQEDYDDSLSLFALPVALGVSESLSPRDRAILKFQKKLDVSAVKDSNILRVSYEATDRKLSELAVDKLMSFFLDQHIRLHRTPGSHKFLQQQLERTRTQLTASELELRDLKNQTGLASPADQRKLLVDRIARLEDELQQAAIAEVATSTERMMSLQTLRGGPDARLTAENDGVADDSMDGMRAQLYALQLKEQELLARFTEDQPEVKQVKRQIDASKVVLEREEQDRRNKKWPRATYEQTQMALLQQDMKLKSLTAKSAAIEEQLKTARDELKILNANELRIQRLERQVQIQDSTYRKYADNLEEANIDQALAMEHISNISVVQPSQSLIKPVRPRKLLNLLLAIALGLMGGLALAVLAEQYERRLKSARDADNLASQPVLVSESRMNESHPKQNGHANTNGKR